MVCVSDTLVALWLWSMTWGLYHVPISLATMTLLLWRMTKKNFIASFFWGSSAVISAYIFFYFCTVIMIMYVCGHIHVPTETPCSTAALLGIHPVCGLALVYICLELLFWRLTPLWRSVGHGRLWLITVLANGVASYIVYLFLCASS